MPTRDALISTKVPALASSSSTVPGRRLAYGPTETPRPSLEPRTTEKATSERSPTTESTIRDPGPMEHSRPTRVAPWRNVNGWIEVSGPMRTSTST